MKKLLSFPLALCLVSAFVFTSCSDDENDGNGGNFSNLSVEQRKQRVESVGVDLMNKINPADHEIAVKAINSLDILLNDANNIPEEDIQPSPFPQFNMKSLRAMTALNNLGGVVGLASGNMTIAEWAELDLGTYTYDSVKEEFDFVSGTDNKVIVKYPMEGSKTNNVKIEASFSNSSTVVDNVIIPSQVDVELSVDGTEQISASVSYKGELDNQNDHAIITIAGKYVAEATVSAKDGSVNCSATLKVGNELLISSTGSISGSFQIPDADASESDIENEAEKINWAKVDINIMGQLAITGTANPGAIIKADNEIGYDDENKATVDALVAVYNANMDVSLVDLSDNTALAKGEMYTYEDKYCYTDWQTNKEICHYYYEEELALRFDDDTMIDFEDFVDDRAGFGELIDAFNRLSQTYEDYIK